MKFEIIKQTPSLDMVLQIEELLKGFVRDSRPGNIDLDGLYQQQVNNVTKAILNQSFDHNFWLLEDDGKALGFVLTMTAVDIDNSNCLYLYAGYADKSVRHTPVIKECVAKCKEHGKQLGCKYSVVVAGRNPKAYKRWLGSKTEDYCTLLKERI